MNKIFLVRLTFRTSVPTGLPGFPTANVVLERATRLYPLVRLAAAAYLSAESHHGGTHLSGPIEVIFPAPNCQRANAMTIENKANRHCRAMFAIHLIAALMFIHSLPPPPPPPARALSGLGRSGRCGGHCPHYLQRVLGPLGGGVAVPANQHVGALSGLRISPTGNDCLPPSSQWEGKACRCIKPLRIQICLDASKRSQTRQS